MKTLPREHGLVVSWSLTILGAIILSNSFHIYGIGLVLMLLPTLLVYDRLIVGLRLWSIGKVDLRSLLLEKVGSKALVLLVGVLAYAAAGLLLQSMPWMPLLAMTLVLLFEGVAFRYLRERHIVTRALSILIVVSQFLLINSALSGSVTVFEVTAFTLLAMVNLLLVAAVVRLVDSSRVHQGSSAKGSIGVDLPFFLAGVVIAAGLSAQVSMFYLSFIVLLISVEVAFRYGMHGKSMKVVGVTSSVVEVLALLLLFLHFYAIL